MPNSEILSLAILSPFEGQESATLALLREFYTMMHAKGYSRDCLYRDDAHADRFLHLRYWKSAEARAEAQADPEVHRYWQKLPQLCTLPKVHESLEKVFET